MNASLCFDVAVHGESIGNRDADVDCVRCLSQTQTFRKNSVIACVILDVALNKNIYCSLQSQASTIARVLQLSVEIANHIDNVRFHYCFL